MSDPSMSDVLWAFTCGLFLGGLVVFLASRWWRDVTADVENDEAVEMANRPYQATNPITGKRPRADLDRRA